jgi:hypothetical protein
LKRNLLPIALTLGTTVFVALFIYTFWFSPATVIGPEQPIPFSHNVHSGVKNIQCRFCHPYVDYSNHPGMPAVEKCLYCHNYIIANHPWIQKEHNYYDTKTPTPWIKVNGIAEHVLFNHQRHIRYGLQCEVCHGQVENQHRLPTKNWRMKECITCHREKGANMDCWLACHS